MECPVYCVLSIYIYKVTNHFLRYTLGHWTDTCNIIIIYREHIKKHFIHMLYLLRIHH